MSRGHHIFVYFVDAVTIMAKRVIACLDVRSNDNGDLVVTKGDQYDVREEGTSAQYYVHKHVSVCYCWCAVTVVM